MFSLPSYRRLSEEDLNHLRNGGTQQTLTRPARILLNVLLLVGLWGLPYYLRALVLSRESDSANAREAIIGVWRPVVEDGLDGIEDNIEFTHAGEFRLSRGGIVRLTGHYRFEDHGDVVLYDLNPPRIVNHAAAPDAQYQFAVSFSEDGLSVAAPQEAAVKRSLEDLQLHLPEMPGSLDRFTHFKRVK